ncbi:NAD-binding protein [Pseudohyphozyma bogoriensis]|nr:NAD-binding protein [Pseudohyphozyma bogoriensis]
MTLGKSALVVGGSRGLGLELVKQLAQRGLEVFATVRSTPGDEHFPAGVKVIPNVDLAVEGASGDALEKGLGGAKVDTVIISAGYFTTDTLETLDWAEHLKMFTTCCIGPAFLASRLSKIDAIRPGGKVFFVTTEGGSITLRTADEGGGNYGHHASKAGANMIGKLLALDLAKKGVTVVNIHPGFMRTEMTKNVGFDEAWDSGGAVEPSVAATSLLDFAEKVTEKDSGKFWAPRGPGDVGQAENVLGKDLPTPLELPW